VAFVAGRAARVFGSHDLRKPFGFGRILFVAPAAQVGDFGQLRHVRGRILGVLRQRTVAGFAGDVRVFSRRARLTFVCVAHQAGVLSGEGDGMLADEIQRAWPVMPVLAEGLGNDRASDHQENRHRGEQDERRPNQVSGIAKHAPHNAPPFPGGSVPTLPNPV